MNNEIRSIIKEHNLKPVSYRKIKKAYVIDTKEERFVLKPNTNNYDIYKYLSSRGFDYFPHNYNKKGNYDLTRFIEDNSLDNSQKLNDLLSVVATLHKKTSYMREVDLDDIKDLYEKLGNKINEGIKYYSELNDYIDTVMFYSPSEYLIIRNISLIYFMLEFSRRKLDEWYSDIKNAKSIRNSLIHNNLDLDHLLINNGYYLISWDKAMFSYPIDDLYQLYSNYYSKMELNDFLRTYQGINSLNKYELDLLLVELSIPEVIEFTSDTYSDTKRINSMLFYLNKVYKMIKNDGMLEHISN